MDTEKSDYPEHLEDIEPDDYILDDTLSSWSREKKPIWKRLVSGSEAPFILMGIGLVVVIVLFLLFSPKGGSDDYGLQLDQLNARVQQLEQNLTAAEAAFQKIQKIEDDIETIRKKTNRLESLDASAALRIDRTIKDFKNLQQEVQALRLPSKKNTVSPTPTTPQGNITPKESKPSPKQPAVLDPKAGPEQEGAVYHQVKKGETLYGISRQHDVSLDTIYRLKRASKRSGHLSRPKTCCQTLG